MQDGRVEVCPNLGIAARTFQMVSREVEAGPTPSRSRNEKIGRHINITRGWCLNSERHWVAKAALTSDIRLLLPEVAATKVLKRARQDNAVAPQNQPSVVVGSSSRTGSNDVEMRDCWNQTVTPTLSVAWKCATISTRATHTSTMPPEVSPTR